MRSKTLQTLGRLKQSSLTHPGYRDLTARNNYLSGLKTNVIAQSNPPHNELDNFIVAECDDWHITPVRRNTVTPISHQAALVRATPVLVVACYLAQPLDP